MLGRSHPRCGGDQPCVPSGTRDAASTSCWAPETPGVFPWRRGRRSACSHGDSASFSPQLCSQSNWPFAKTRCHLRLSKQTAAATQEAVCETVTPESHHIVGHDPASFTEPHGCEQSQTLVLFGSVTVSKGSRCL